MDIFKKNTRRIEKGHKSALYRWCIRNSLLFRRFSLEEQAKDDRLKKFNYWYCEDRLYLIRYIPFDKGELGFVKFLAIKAASPLDAVYALIENENNSLICIEKTNKRYCKDLNNFIRLQIKKRCKNEHR